MDFPESMRLIFRHTPFWDVKNARTAKKLKKQKNKD